MLRWLKRTTPIHISQPVHIPNFSELIHNFIGWEVSIRSFEPDKEEIAQFTTKHSAIITNYTTQPIQTEQFRKARLTDG